MRLLLTQSQVSVALSSAIVFFFTLLLFLSGYVLQQKSVRGLSELVKPRIPQRPPSSSPREESQSQTIELSNSRLFGENGGSRIVRTDFDRDIHAADAAQIDWNRLAHVQLVQNHHDVCNAIMFLADLHRKRSPARRVLLFPKAWITQAKKPGRGDVEDPYLDSTKRLMRLAVRRYKVDLHPVDPIRSSEKEGDVYSLASAYALYGSFDRILSLETPGLLQAAEPLDAVLAFTEPAPFVMLHDTIKNDNIHPQDLFLLQPSKRLHDGLVELLATPEFSTFNDTYLATLFADPVLLASSTEDSALIRSVGTLHDAGSSFNQTAYLEDVAYVRFSDPKLPGPEYDVPWAQKVAARPKNKDADWVWTKLYGEFAEKRMDTCGLDLESWRPR